MTGINKRSTAPGNGQNKIKQLEDDAREKRARAKATLQQADLNEGKTVNVNGRNVRRDSNSQVVKDERRTGDYRRYANASAKNDLRSASYSGHDAMTERSKAEIARRVAAAKKKRK